MPTEQLVSPSPTTTAPSITSGATATASHTGRFYRQELDVLRCLAFFLVFSSHVLPFPHSASAFTFLSAIQEGVSGGVPLFFILTSFLITELLLREQDATGTIHIQAFYVRRILRIWPLYFLVLGLAVALPHLMHSFDPIGIYVAPFVLLAGNWVIVHHGWFHNPLLTPLWSTPVQEQFYLVWPLLVFWWGRRGIVILSAILLPLAWLMDYGLPALHYSRSPVLWCNSLNQFQFFALGAILAVFMHNRTLRIAFTTRVALFLGAAVVFFLAGTPLHFINDFMPSTPAYTLAAYLCLDAGCVLLCLAFLGAHMPKFTHPLVYLGKISFGMYIFQYTILSVVETVVKKKLHLAGALQLPVIYIMTALLAVLVASVSYRYFETPFLRLKSRFTFIRSRPT